jgi:hypothetical protein
MQVIVCNNCKNTKSIDCFYSYSLTKCKACFSEYQKAYHAANKDKRSEYAKEHYKANRENHLLKNKQYYLENKLKHQEACRLRSLERRRSDIQYKLTKLLRKRLNSAIKNKAKSGSAVRDVGCTIEELKTYLESKFQPGMTWENWSLTGWHIDHIVPLSKFDLTDSDQLRKACHYTNLQPMWAKDNLIKSNKYV